VPGSTTLKAIYLDRNSTQPAANPYTLSSDGTAQLYGDGLYDVKITTSGGVQKYYWEDVKIQDVARELVYFDSLSDAVTSIGSTKTTLIVATDTTTNSLTIPSNIELQTTNGAIITINSGQTLTINGPVLFATSQVFAGTGSVTGLKEARSEWFGVNTDPGTTDMGAAIQKAVTAANKIIFIGAYAKSSAITVPSDRILEGYGATITTTADNINGFNVTGSNVTFRGLTINGPQHTVLSTSRGISAVGADSANYLTDINIIDCNLSTWGIYGIYMQFVDGFSISKTQIENIFYAGVMGLSVKNGIINNKTTVKNVTGNISNNAYGVALSRIENDSLATHPRSMNVVVDGVIIDNVTVWEGLDTHGGENIQFINNTIKNCKAGIGIVGSDNGTQTPSFAPLNSSAINNTINSGKTDGTASYGIAFAGAQGISGASIQYATGSIIGNRIIGHGDETNNISGGIYLRDTSALVVNGNNLIEAGSNAIHVYHDNKGISLIGNTIVDVWSNTSAAAYGINMSSDYNTGTISGNTFSLGTKTATYIMPYRMRAGNVANNKISVGLNHYVATAKIIDQNIANITFTGGPFTGSKTWDPPSVLAGANTTTTVTVDDVVVGNSAQAGFSLALPVGVYLRAEVTAANTVTVTLVNGSASTQDIASGTLTVTTFK